MDRPLDLSGGLLLSFIIGFHPGGTDPKRLFAFLPQRLSDVLR